MLVAAAALFGLAGGYGWSALNAPQAKLPPHPKAAFMPIPPSPEEQPAASDVQWTAEADDSGTAAASSNVHYSGCNEVRAAGKAPLDIGEPGYRADMDGDGDGIACEPVRAR
jgi:Excalibur calcium-binding domain